MYSNVPQFINKEDKIVGPLTAKQLGWLGAGGVSLIVLWNLFDFSTFLVLAIIVGAICGSFAFYRPYDQPLLKFLTSSIFFAVNPKMYIWKRNYDKIETVSRSQKKKKNTTPTKKTLTNQKISDLSKILDS